MGSLTASGLLNSEQKGMQTLLGVCRLNLDHGHSTGTGDERGLSL